MLPQIFKNNFDEIFKTTIKPLPLLIDAGICSVFIYFEFYNVLALFVFTMIYPILSKFFIRRKLNNFDFLEHVEGVFICPTGKNLIVTTFPYLKEKKKVFCFDLKETQFLTEKDSDRDSGISFVWIKHKEHYLDLFFSEKYLPEVIGKSYMIFLEGDRQKIDDYVEKTIQNSNEICDKIDENTEMVVESSLEIN